MALLTRVGESVKHVTGGYKLRSRPLEFAAIGEYLDTFALKLGTIDRIAQRIIKEEIGELFIEITCPGTTFAELAFTCAKHNQLQKCWWDRTRPHFTYKQINARRGGGGRDQTIISRFIFRPSF